VTPADETTSLSELARLFLRLGATSFGGPVAHIAMMEEEVVERRRWMSAAHFLDLVSATNLIPGPNSTELAIHIGWERRRWAGLFVAGGAFIAPAVAITLLAAWVYVHFGALPMATGLLRGVKPVVLAIVVQAIVGLAPKAAPSRRLQALGVAGLVAVAAGVDELVVLGGAGLTALATATRPPPADADRGTTSTPQKPPHALLPALGGSAALAAGSATAPAIFLVFLKIGSVLFGSGYVLVAFLRADLVTRLGWLTEAQLLDAVAVGQVTPGPVFTTATFIGYLLGGPAGALAATAGIFAPAFAFVAASAALLPRLRQSPRARAFLDGLNVASLALMVFVAATLARTTLVDLPTAALALASSGLLLRWRPNPTWLIVGGGALGLLASRFGA
jgi:chromate transporter